MLLLPALLARKNFELAAARARASSPGPDGIPFAARAAASTNGGQTPAQFELLARFGSLIPAHFDESSWIFTPKTSEEQTAKGIVNPARRGR